MEGKKVKELTELEKENNNKKMINLLLHTDLRLLQMYIYHCLTLKLEGFSLLLEHGIINIFQEEDDFEMCKCKKSRSKLKYSFKLTDMK